MSRLETARAAMGYPGYPQEPALTADERTRAARVKVWVIWYEDRFGEWEDQDSFPLALCLSAEEGEAEYRRRIGSGENKPLQPGWDGITLEGPWELLREAQGPQHVWCGVDVIREVLRKVKRGEPGPVPVPIR